MKIASSIVVALALALSSTADAFVPTSNAPATSRTSNTQVHLFDIFNEGKKKLVKSLAGEYDEAAIKARVNGLIADSPVLMFSFTT